MYICLKITFMLIFWNYDWDFSKIFIFPLLFKALVWQWLIAVVAVVLSWCLFSPAFPTLSKLILQCASWCFMMFVFSKKWDAKTLETLIKTIYMLLWTSPFDNFSDLLCNFTLNVFSAELFFDNEWMKLQLVCVVSVFGISLCCPCLSINTCSALCCD